MLATTTVFLAITTLFVYLHLRRTEGRRAGAPPVPAGRPCPRCLATVPAGSASCPACGISMQIFELVSARIVTETGPVADGRLHAVVRADMCVGCGTCAAACPEPDAIALRGKIAVVDRERCVGHGRCAEACPVGAIVLTRGEAVQRVEVPDLSSGFESSVPGLYVVGELGGRGLIKNAVNEGRIAVEHLTGALRRPGEPPAGNGETLDLIVVGSGPAGLSAGLEAHRSGLRYAVLEQGDLADSIRKYPRHKVVLAEPVRIPLYGELWVGDGSKEALLEVWRTVVADTRLDLRTGHRVEDLRRVDGVFQVEAAGRTFEARKVVLATGRRGTPRRLGVPGEELDKVFYDIVEMEAFAGRRLVVAGGGDSAVESALGLANQVGTTVHLVHRGDGFERAKERNRAKLEQAVSRGTITPLVRATIREIRREAVVLDSERGPILLPNDDVVIRVGGEPSYRFLERAGVRLVRKDVPLPSSNEVRAT